MKHIFLSYTYRSHPGYEAEIDALQRTVRRVIEAMDLRVVDGRDLGGRLLDAEIDRRIRDADAFIALLTPQADGAGQPVLPDFVGTEFQAARVLDKPRLRVLHHELVARGLGANEEYSPFEPANTLEVVMKLLGTIALWKKERGRGVEIRIEPEELATKYDRRTGRCEYELMIAAGQTLQPATTYIWPEPGGPMVYVPNFIDGARVRIQLDLPGEQWKSTFVAPQLGGIILTKS